jgi:hypothetical protein
LTPGANQIRSDLEDNLEPNYNQFFFFLHDFLFNILRKLPFRKEKGKKRELARRQKQQVGKSMLPKIGGPKIFPLASATAHVTSQDGCLTTTTDSAGVRRVRGMAPLLLMFFFFFTGFVILFSVFFFLEWRFRTKFSMACYVVHCRISPWKTTTAVTTPRPC